jgi:hypothetical protein
MPPFSAGRRTAAFAARERLATKEGEPWSHRRTVVSPANRGLTGEPWSHRRNGALRACTVRQIRTARRCRAQNRGCACTWCQIISAIHDLAHGARQNPERRPRRRGAPLRCRRFPPADAPERSPPANVWQRRRENRGLTGDPGPSGHAPCAKSGPPAAVGHKTAAVPAPGAKSSQRSTIWRMVHARIRSKSHQGPAAGQAPGSRQCTGVRRAPGDRSAMPSAIWRRSGLRGPGQPGQPPATS